jgi:hypothetical protein
VAAKVVRIEEVEYWSAGLELELIYGTVKFEGLSKM